MPEIKNVFTSGRMNKDLDERLLSNNEYRDALNIQVASTDGSDIGVVQTLKGNVSKYAGDGKCIATVVDNENNKIYWFVKDTVSSEILEYDPSTETTVQVVDDSTNAVLEFTDSIITGIVLFEGFIAWTDNVNEPKIIDIEEAKLSPSSITLNDITIIKKKPLNAPTLNITTVEDGSIVIGSPGVNFFTQPIGNEFNVDLSALSVAPVLGDIIEFIYIDTAGDYIVQAEIISTTASPNLKVVYRNNRAATDSAQLQYSARIFKQPIFEEKFVRFAYRWKYDNDQYSVMSPFSDTVFYPNVYKEYSIEDGYNNKMVNSITDLTLENIEVPEGVKEVEILYKESNNTNIYVYDRILNITTPTTTATVDIEKENIYAVLESSQLLRAYDMVPKKAKALEVIGNRLVFGNYETGFDLSDYTPNLSISLIEVNNGDDLKSLKSGRSYEFGVVFEDDYGRQTPVVTTPNLVYKIPYGDEGKSKRFQVTLNNFPSDSNLTKYKIYIKESSQEYYNILIDKAFEDNSDNSAYWLSVPSYEINKFSEGDFLLLKKGANTDQPVNNELAKYKILDVSNSKPDNVDSADNFDGRFFIKINKDDRISTEFLSSLGLAGQSNFIEPNDTIDVSTVPSNSSSLGYLEYEEEPSSGIFTRYDYYYKDGQIYRIESTGSGTTFSFGAAITSDVTVGNVTLAVSDNWDNPSESPDVADVVFYAQSILSGRDVRFFVHFTSTAGLSVIPAIFETTVKDDLLDIYYETNNTYDKEQTPTAKTLSWYNCFNFGNGLESNRIKDDYNEVVMEKGVRVSSTLSYDFNVIQAKNGIIWSGLFNARGGVNNLNQFNSGLKITKDLNPEYGSVQLLHARNTDLIAICEDKVLKLLANKDALYNADGNVNLTSTNNVIGQAIPFNGEFGTQNPESFSFYGYQAYFTDKSRGSVLRLSIDGLTPISMANTVSYFRNKLKAHTGSIIGSYDIHTLQYILSFENDESISYSESSKGWTSRLNFVPEQGCYLNGEYYTFKNGNLWLHHAGSIGNFYGADYDSSVKLIHNANPSLVKTFKTLNYEGTDGWYVPSISTNLDTGKINEFVNKENKFYNYIKGATDVLDTSQFNTQGIGVISSISGLGTLEISFDYDINVSLQVNSDEEGSYVGGDTIYFIDGNDVIQSLGKCKGITGRTITVGPIASEDPVPVVGQYVLFSKSRIVNTGGLKGYYMEVDIQTTDNIKYRELFSVGTEAFISS